MTAPRRLRGAIFDVGDIVYDATAWRRWLADRLAQLGADIDYPRLKAGWEAALVPVYLGEQDYWAAFAGYIGGLGEQGLDTKNLNLEGLADEARQKGAECSAAHEPFPGVAEGLKRLRAGGIAVAALSDTESPRARVEAKLTRFGLDGLFNAIVTSVDIRAVKPMPEAFSAALAALGLQTADCAFVAHDVDELQGSTEFGLYTIAFNYTPGAPADFHAEAFSEVVDEVLRHSPSAA